MAEKRKDNKGRVLRTGESQRKDGKYEYKYNDTNGIRRTIYSWKLVATDKVPKGKRCEEDLRSIEKRINRDVEDEIDTYTASKTSLNEFFNDYIISKIDLKQSTRTNYKYMYNKYVREEIGFMDIASIKYSVIKKFYLNLIHNKGFKPNSMEIIHTILHPIFTTAVRDGYIRVNPTDGAMTEIKRSHDWSKPKRRALTEKEQELFINFLIRSEQYKTWKPLITVILGTGCRIGEIIGLRWEDCNFEDNVISINHNLIYRQQDNGKCEFHITTTKTKNAIRIVPMLKEVRKALLDTRIEQMRTGFNRTVIDGYSGFVFKNRYDTVYSPHAINRAIERIRLACNDEEERNAIKEGRIPIIIPHFSVHNLRHTFCTRFCENETNLKVIQEIMGHADITTTMDIYNEATKEKKVESFINLDGKIKIG